MQAAGNEYVAQLLDRAATLIRDLEPADGATEAQEHEINQWLNEYQAEKARFGQPLGSPAYQDAVQATRGENVLEGTTEDGGDARRSRRLKPTEDQLRAQGEGGTRPEDYDGRYDDMSAAELQTEAGRRGLAKSGTKPELIDRLHQSDMGTSAG